MTRLLFWTHRMQTLMVLLLWSILLPSQASAHANRAPSSAERAHPYLFFTQDTIPTLQAQSEGDHRFIWQSIHDYATHELGQLPPTTAPNENDGDTYRNFGNRLIPLAFACVVLNQDHYCATAKETLLTYANWSQWETDGKLDLGTAHLLLGNSLAYDWLYSRLTSEERQRVRVSLGQWAQAMYEASASPSYNDGWDNWWRKSYVQNHFWTNNSALGMAGLALLGEDERADVWVAHAKAQLIHVRDLLNAINDGSWHEGIHYQSYGLTMMLPFLVNLRALDGTDLIPHTYLRNYPAWRLYNYLPGTTQFILAYANFDWSWGNAYSPQNLLRFAAAEYGDGSAEWMAQQLDSAGGRGANVYNTPWHVLEFLYYDATVAAQPPSDVTQAHLFPDLEAVIWRTGWGEEDLVFGFKSGAYGGRFGFNSFTQGAYPWPVPCPETGCQLNTDHDHDDTNGFYIYQGGQWLAPESEGYRRTATSLHNTLLIDGQGQYRPAWERFGHHPEDYLASDGFLQQTADTTNFNYVVGDATRRYKQIDGIEAVTRHVVFVRPGYFLLLDHVAAATPHTYEWISHFGGAVTVDGHWIRGDAGNGQVLGINVVAPQDFTSSTGDDGKPFIRISPTTATATTRFITLLVPTETSRWATRPTASLLSDDGTSAAIRVAANDGSGQVDDILIHYGSAAQRQVGAYGFDGDVAVVRHNQQGMVSRIFVDGGSTITDDEQKAWASGIATGPPFEASFEGATVVISGELTDAFRLYAPGVQSAMYNGQPQEFTRQDDYIAFAPASPIVVGPVISTIFVPLLIR